ncbi:hypothetical protein DSO57_1001140 [Entomophthora muscae]|uniref:Uncharacterized protein n=1 Tax=Entomophthora muscae TaxID=34485 RepID=A0ACC2S003_9FUNG|nr:hypothetical protein DSO57_1001140 [Entomophthora muscae]
MCHEPYQAPSTAKTLATCPTNNAQAARSAHLQQLRIHSHRNPLPVQPPECQGKG